MLKLVVYISVEYVAYYEVSIQKSFDRLWLDFIDFIIGGYQFIFLVFYVYFILLSMHVSLHPV